MIIAEDKRSETEAVLKTSPADTVSVTRIRASRAALAAGSEHKAVAKNGSSC